MIIDKHTLPMNGLKAASGYTKGLGGYYSGEYVQISYDTNTGDIFTDYHYNFGQNWWTVYHGPDVISCGNVSEDTSMQEIADMIYRAVKSFEQRKKRGAFCIKPVND